MVVSSTGKDANSSGLFGSLCWNPSPEFLDFTSTVRTFPPPMQTSTPVALTLMSFCVNFAPGGGLIVTIEVLLLLLPVGSVEPETTEAELLSGPTGKVNGTLILMVTTALLFGAVGASVPMLQVTVVEPVQVPAVEVAETSVTPAGIGSVTTTLVATEGPLFVAVIV